MTVNPKIFLIGETRIVDEGLQAYLTHLGVPNWQSDATSDVEKLIEVDGRLCYRSFEPGLNPNVTRIRGSNAEYIANILKTKHGSVIEHPVINFIFADVSRVFTHELVRHRVGTAMSQESLRFVRVKQPRVWTPTVIKEDEEAMEVWTSVESEIGKLWSFLEENLTRIYQLDDSKTNFHVKKLVTSAMRRWLPDGMATTIGWSANPRTLRWVIEMRTDPAAEEEIRLVFCEVARICIARYPNLFGDFTAEMVDGLPWYRPANSKI